MKNKLIEFLVFIVFISFIINPSLVKKEILDSLNTFITILFPSIFPFLIISDLLLNYNFHITLNKLFNKINSFLFHTSSISNFVIIMSIFTGFPSGSKYIKTLYNKNMLSMEEANYLITFTHFSNPLFLLTLSSTLLNNKLSYILLFSHIMANFIIAFITRPKNNTNKKEIEIINSVSFTETIKKSINDSISLLTIILGTTCIFFFLSGFITNYFNLHGINKVLINGFFDLTKGINSISILNTTNLFKGILILTFISFGGINVHMQVLSILENTKISYKNFLFGRISQVALSCLLFFILFNICQS